MTLREQTKLFEVRRIAVTILAQGGIFQASKQLRIHRNTIYRKLLAAGVVAPITVAKLRTLLQERDT